ncbi:GUN4 domain-containing protein [Pseudanabaena sp. FACHB-1998]|uniref:GUN4 domain-containing protein n=1 Tax=Pseudanabaena sp. FACHB-1998 TaxID=2692858 RepID=UPI0016804FD6|nr:GUN4 domain-containing protein [Pseudanabaena sp. FACHB-1998]MBD2175787.1 GUN4 domain-containing protein [Pseudanabaena sp. FACHB-1998]
MNSEEILIEFVAGDRAKDGAIKPISSTKIKDSIQRLANLVQHLGNESSSTHANGLELDEVEISVKFTDAGEAILLGDGQSNGAMTLRFRRPQAAIGIANGYASSTSAKLTSSTGVDYTKLQDLLSSSKWQEANQETWNVMCQAARKKIGSVLTAEDLKQVSCDDLKMIDQLWQQYSQGRYGFSSQNQIYMSSILG